jgi:hypothetical protein
MKDRPSGRSFQIVRSSLLFNQIIVVPGSQIDGIGGAGVLDVGRNGSFGELKHNRAAPFD